LLCFLKFDETAMDEMNYLCRCHIQKGLEVLCLDVALNQGDRNTPVVPKEGCTLFAFESRKINDQRSQGPTNTLVSRCRDRGKIATEAVVCNDELAADVVATDHRGRPRESGGARAAGVIDSALSHTTVILGPEMRNLRMGGAADSQNGGDLGTTKLRGIEVAVELWREPSLTGNHPSARKGHPPLGWPEG